MEFKEIYRKRTRVIPEGSVTNRVNKINKNYKHKLDDIDFWNKSHYLTHFHELSKELMPNVPISEVERIVSAQIQNPVHFLYNDNIKPGKRLKLDAYLIKKIIKEYHYDYTDFKKYTKNKKYRTKSEKKQVIKIENKVKNVYNEFEKRILLEKKIENAKRIYKKKQDFVHNYSYFSENIKKTLSVFNNELLEKASNYKLQLMKLNTNEDSFNAAALALSVEGSPIGELNLDSEFKKLSNWLNKY